MTRPTLRHALATLLSAAVMTAQAARGADLPPPPPPEAMNAAEIQLAFQKLNVLGRVLYVAAHPDDENTGLLAYLANGALLDTAYLSLTRGDGGQNLIGPELRERLGVIRTQELLAARRVDHAAQFFTRAVDFGFSKNPEETLRFWDRESILADTVWVIRRFQPDVVISRFAPDDRQTHGHHTASALLAQEAFRAAGDPARFPEQLRFVPVWQPRRLVWNTSAFFFSARGLPFDPTGLASMETGGWSPLLGKSFGEIAAASRSMHKSQGFGVPVSRASRKEFFKPLDGEPMRGGPLDGVDTTWSRVPGAAGVPEKTRALLAGYTPADPAASVPGLLELRAMLDALPPHPWVARKRAETDALLAACLGLHLEAVSKQALATPGQPLPLQFEAITRVANAPAVRLRALHLPATGETVETNAALAPGQPFVRALNPTLPETLAFSQPYWLRHPGTTGVFTVDDQELIGRPENPPAFPVEAVVDIAGQEVRFTVETRFRRTDPVEGETSQPLVIAPPVFAGLSAPVYIFGDRQPKMVPVRVSAATGAVRGRVALETPAGWRVEPASVPVELPGADAETVAVFTVFPPDTAAPAEGVLRAVVSVGERRYSVDRQRLAYAHIGVQTLLPAAEARLVRADVQRRGTGRIGYLPGAGDEVPGSLEQIGYTVKMLGESDLNADTLAGFDAVVLGVRAANTRDRLGTALPGLLAYVRRGGVVVAQYNTTTDLKTDKLGPFPLHLSRERVTDETAPVRFLAPDHPALLTPNRLTPADFDGWVQERGLYFPDTWDPGWTPLLSMNDPGEKPLDGALLVAREGEGYFVYTGLSFFRQLPAGVPGAYRLFANLLSLGK